MPWPKSKKTHDNGWERLKDTDQPPTHPADTNNHSTIEQGLPEYKGKISATVWLSSRGQTRRRQQKYKRICGQGDSSKHAIDEGRELLHTLSGSSWSTWASRPAATSLEQLPWDILTVIMGLADSFEALWMLRLVCKVFDQIYRHYTKHLLLRLQSQGLTYRFSSRLRFLKHCRGVDLSERHALSNKDFSYMKEQQRIIERVVRIYKTPGTMVRELPPALWNLALIASMNVPLSEFSLFELWEMIYCYETRVGYKLFRAFTKDPIRRTECIRYITREFTEVRLPDMLDLVKQHGHANTYRWRFRTHPALHALLRVVMAETKRIASARQSWNIFSNFHFLQPRIRVYGEEGLELGACDAYLDWVADVVEHMEEYGPSVLTDLGLQDFFLQIVCFTAPCFADLVPDCWTRWQDTFSMLPGFDPRWKPVYMM